MANKKISDLTAGGAAADTDLIEIETTGGLSFKQTLAAIWTWAKGKVAAGGALGLTLVKVGTEVTQDSDPTFLTARLITSSAGSPHAFSDSSVLSFGGGFSYNSFSARIQVGGTGNYDHFSAFQFNGLVGTSGTTTNVYSFFAAPIIDAGTVTNAYGLHVYPYRGTGTITNAYGVFVDNLDRGTNRFGIYQAGASDLNYYAGGVRLLNRMRVENDTYVPTSGKGLEVAFNDTFNSNQGAGLVFTFDRTGGAYLPLFVGGLYISFLTGSGGATLMQAKADELVIQPDKWIRMNGDAGPIIRAGGGSPEGVIPAQPSSLWLRTNGSIGTSLYVKSTGSGATGWSPLATGTPSEKVLGWNPGVGVKRMMLPDGNAGTDFKLGFRSSATGNTEIPSPISATNRLSRAERRGQLSTVANAEYGWRWSAGLIFRADSGFIYEAMGGFGVGATMSQKRLFIGMRAVNAFPGASVDPSSFLNIAGIGADTADANWQIMRNDGTGTATKVDTGWAKTLGDVLYVRVTGTNDGIYIYAERYAAANLTATPTAVFTETLYTTDIPTAATETAPLFWGCNGATAENGTLNYIVQAITSPY